MSLVSGASTTLGADFASSNLPNLDAELRPIHLADARSRGLTESAARTFEAAADGRRTVLSVVRLTAGTATADALEVGDLLLAINGVPATSFAQVEREAQAAQIRLEVLRGGRELTLDFATTPLSGRGTDRCVIWSGAVLQAPHRAVAAQRGLRSAGVYVSWFWYGSPANSAGLRATHRIVEVEDVPTPDLDAFLAAVSGREDGGSVRIRTVGLEGRSRVIALKLDLQFWPTSELRRDGRHWERVDHGPRG